MGSLYENSVVFCKAFYEFDVSALFLMLSPHCRLQNKYGNTSRGVNGNINCLKKLHDIQRALMDHFRIVEHGKHHVYEMNDVQSLVYIFTKKEAKTDRQFSVGFSLEWECNVITGIVFNYHLEKLNVDTFVFLMYCTEDCTKSITDVELFDDEVKELTSSAELAESFDGLINLDKETVTLHTSVDVKSRSTIHRRSSLSMSPVSAPSKGVAFDDNVRVILIPKTRGADLKALYFSSNEFRRFQRDKSDEIEAEMQCKNCTKEEAVVFLYHNSDKKTVAKNTTKNGICEVKNVISVHTDGPDACASSVDDADDDESEGSRLSFDDEVDRNSIEKQQLEKDAMWQRVHVDKIKEFSNKKDPKKKVLFPPRGFVLKRYLPPPKVIHPTVVYVSLLRCQNLTPSVFWPIVSTDSYVNIVVDGERQTSEVVRRKRNPKYNSTEIYIFALEYESTLNSYIEFQVYDETMTAGGDSLLGVARVAFSALRFQSTPRPPQKITLPLSASPRQLSRSGPGRGFYPSDEDDELKRVGVPCKQPTPLEKHKKSSSISVLIAVVDDNLCKTFATLQSQDAETEARLGAGVPWIEGDPSTRQTLSSDGVLHELSW